jgi:tripartite-type tricarboxylate transporter receptor subunit TctC
LFVSSGHAIANALHRNLPFDVLTDFSAVIQVSSVPLAIVTPPGFPGNTIGSFVALARKMPGKLNYASSGVSSQSYLAAEVFKQAAGIDVLHLPYKGAPDAMTSVMRGDSQLYFLGVNLVPGLVEGGKVQVLAVASPSRVALLPNVQTTAEAGLPDFSFEAWFGLVAPAGTPKEVLGKLYGDISRVLRMGDVQEKMTGQGLLVSGRTGEEFDALIRSEAERYGAMLRRAGVGEN